MKKNIAIFGAGIAGLSVAHELSKFSNYKINLYEKKDQIGGLARSNRDLDGCATEYCWRVYFGFYQNLLKILKEIPLIENNKKSVLNNLAVYTHINISDSQTSFKDWLIALYKVFYGFTSCNARLDKLDNVTWWQALGASKTSSLFREIATWLGMDRYKGSFKSVVKVGMELHMLNTILSKGYKDFVTTKPTSEAWFDHWKKDLNNKKVRLNLKYQLQSLQIKDNQVYSARVMNIKSKKITSIVADEYILSLPIEALANLVEQTPQLKVGDLKNAQKLKIACYQMQLSFQLYFDRKISLGIYKKSDNNSFLLVDSPWDLIVLSYDQVYSNTKLSNKLKGVKGGWSVAACTTYTPGIVYGKPMNECSYEEITTELWAQLTNSKKLRKIIKENNTFELSKDRVIKWTPMWPTYSTDQKGKLTTTEPKFTNNAGSYALRPSYKTPFSNLYLASAYVKETIDVFSMEAAAYAGKSVAKAIEPRATPVFTKNRPALFSPFRKIDSVLYKYNFPNLNPLLVMSFIFLLLVSLVYLIFLRGSYLHSLFQGIVWNLHRNIIFLSNILRPHTRIILGLS